VIDRVADGHWRATCEGCGGALDHDTELRESVVLKLLREHWRVRAGHHTWCPLCVDVFKEDEAPTSRMLRVPLE
jgi:hypothetical protein